MNKPTGHSAQLARWERLGMLADEEIDLIDAALLVALDEYPDMDEAECHARIAVLSAEAERRLSNLSDPALRLMAISRYLFEEQGFSGNHDAFYDPRNSYINEVLQRRLGIPLSLGLLQMELARRCDMALQSISFPGHFLVRLQVGEGLIVLDPYAQGRSIDVEDLRQRAQSLQADQDVDDAQLSRLLLPASHRQIVVRMLRNLKNLYLESEDWPRALRSADRLARLQPGDAEALRDRGALYQKIGHTTAARSDLSRYLECAPDADDAESVRNALIDLGATLRLH